MTPYTKRLWVYTRPHWKLLTLALLCMAATAASTGAYAYLVGPVVKFLFAGGLAQDDSLTHALEFIGLSPTLHDRSYLIRILPGLVIGAAIVKGFGQFGKFYLMGSFGEKSVFGLRADLLSHLHRLPLERASHLSTGDIITRVSSDITLVQESITNVIGSLISDSLTILVLLSVAVALDWRLALTTLVVLPAVAFPISWISRRLRRTATGVQRSRAQIADHVQQDMHGLGLIKAYQLETERDSRFESINRHYLSASLKSYAIRALASPIMEWIGALGLAATIWLAAARMADGTLVPEHFVSFFAAVLLLYEPLKNLGRLNNHFQSGRAGALRALEILDWEPEPDLGQRALETFSDSLVLREVSCRLGDRRVLDNASVSIRKGDFLALVGESGAGKTTLARLLMRQLTPASGEIFLDGIPYTDLSLASLRRLVTLVEQAPVLFDISIRENIHLSRPEASSAELDQVIQTARLSHLIGRLPNGMHTRVGEAGARLSEGEKQRIAIARALLRQTPIVIFDEVTAALDPENSAAIQSAIFNLSAQSTVILITHRWEQIPTGARIARLSDGRIHDIDPSASLTDQRTIIDTE